MKASFMIIPALLLSAAAQHHVAKSNKARGTPAAQAPPLRALKRGWFNWKTKPRAKDAG
jgi:hypothetical protein